MTRNINILALPSPCACAAALDERVVETGRAIFQSKKHEINILAHFASMLPVLSSEDCASRNRRSRCSIHSCEDTFAKHDHHRTDVASPLRWSAS